MSQLRILNVGEGDRTLKFDPNNPEERENAKIAVTEMLKLGFAIFVRDGERDGQPLYARATGFDAMRNEYVIVGVPEQESPRQGTPRDPGSKTERSRRQQTRRVPADKTDALGVARSAGGMSDREDSIEARNRELPTTIPIAVAREGFRRAAALRNQWAGIPMPLPDFPLVIEPRYPNASAFRTVDEDCEPVENIPRGFTVRNCFYSHNSRRDVWVWAEATGGRGPEGTEPEYTANKDGQFDGRIEWGRRGALHHFKLDVGAMYVSPVWGIEQETKAQHTLRELLTEDAFCRYLMTGMFVEQSPRSGIYYFFRRLRPTVAVSGRDGDMKIIAALCAHPIAYYAGTWAGAMCPTDDVIAHLMMMRGDEAFYWRRCNQHPAYRPEAGL
jgi:hypothetical protein